jgi:hypothetical protein
MKYFVILILSIIPQLSYSSVFTISAYIDGVSELVIDGNNTHWHHIAFAAPGRWQGHDYPTIINGKEWLPEWPEPGRNDFCDCDSTSVSDLLPEISDTSQVSLNVINARGPVSIVDTYHQDNTHNFIILFDDYTPGGASWYDIELHINTSPIPVPSSFVLMAAGLAGLLYRKKPHLPLNCK